MLLPLHAANLHNIFPHSCANARFGSEARVGNNNSLLVEKILPSDQDWVPKQLNSKKNMLTYTNYPIQLIWTPIPWLCFFKFHPLLEPSLEMWRFRPSKSHYSHQQTCLKSHNWRKPLEAVHAPLCQPSNCAETNHRDKSHDWLCNCHRDASWKELRVTRCTRESWNLKSHYPGEV